MATGKKNVENVRARQGTFTVYTLFLLVVLTGEDKMNKILLWNV